MKIKFIIFVLSTLLLNGCIKMEDLARKIFKEPEPPTTVNHFYFYVKKDGKDKLFIAKDQYGDLGMLPGIRFEEEAGANNQGQLLEGSSYAFRLGIFFYGGISHTGIYTLKHSDEATPQGAGGNTQLNQNQAYMYGSEYPDVYISEDNCGSVEITYLSPDKREFKGRFNMTLYSPFAHDSIVIKNGHFWINLDTY